MISHAQFGKAHHLDEDMAAYRAHDAGRYSTMSMLDGWLFNIDGLRRYNAWLGYRHCKTFAEAIVGYCKYVLRASGKEDAAPLNWYQFIKILCILVCYQCIHAVLDFPRTCSLVAQRAFGRYTRKKKLSKLPKRPDSAQWHFIWGLNAKAIEGHEIVADQPILQLTAVSTPDLYAQTVMRSVSA